MDPTSSNRRACARIAFIVCAQYRTPTEERRHLQKQHSSPLSIHGPAPRPVPWGKGRRAVDSSQRPALQNDVTNPDSASVSGRVVRWLTMLSLSVILGKSLKTAVAKRQRGQYEKIQGRRGHEPAENHDGHRALNLFTRLTAAER